jgi:hypothetical protein
MSLDKLIRKFETMLAALLLAGSTAHKTLPLRITQWVPVKSEHQSYGDRMKLQVASE